MSPDGFRRLPAFTLHAKFASLELSMPITKQKGLYRSYIAPVSLLHNSYTHTHTNTHTHTFQKRAERT